VYKRQVRDRPGDVPLLIDSFLQRYNREFGKNVQGLSPECVARLAAHGWAGNVREIKNVIQRAVLVCTGNVILLEHLPQRLQQESPTRPRPDIHVGMSLREVEREMIVRTLKEVNNNKKVAAQMLGISRRSLYNKMKRHGCEGPARE